MAVKNIILGTAGHIDHGKTTFIKALTGIDCDRLKEERERGITIELGYAKLMLPSGIKVGIVDVPGHEKFVNKMVSGASGIDVVALIIAADEGIKPQTKEHLCICDILGIKKGIVVVTKKDLVDDELLELQKEDIKDFLKGSNLENAPIIPVSSVTGEGINDFVIALDKIANEVGEKPIDMPFRLPIDDVVIIKGFGTVVRGTVISGKVRQNDEICLLPSKDKYRVRGLQSHGVDIKEGVAGERLAINLTDIKKEEIERGMVVAKSGYFEPTDRLLIEINYLKYNEKPLKPKYICQFHVLTSRVTAELFLLHKDKLLPGEKGYAMARLSKPITVCHGDMFVIRGFGIYTTIGGGKILNPHIPTFNRKYFTEDYLSLMSQGKLGDIISIFVKENKEAGITLDSLCGLIKAEFPVINESIKTLEKNNIITKDEKGRYYHMDVVTAYKQNLLKILERFHLENPLKMGINKDELFMRSGSCENIFPLCLKMLVSGNRIEVKGDVIKDVNFKGDTGSDKLFESIEEKFESYGLQSEDLEVVAKELKTDVKKLKDALATLVKQGRLHKIKDDYYVASSALSKLKDDITVFFKQKDILTPQDAKQLTGLSRKYLIPLLEYFDTIKFTIRLADGRKLRK